jgi:hypothetical protein
MSTGEFCEFLSFQSFYLHIRYYLKGDILAYVIPWACCLSYSNSVLAYGFKKHQSGESVGEIIWAGIG